MEFNDSATHGASITDLYMEAAKSNEARHCRNPNTLVARLQAAQTAFTVFRGAFTALLTTYSTSNRYAVGELLHALLSSPRRSTTTFQFDKVDAVHEMLQLKRGEALLDQAHPVCRDWDPELGGGIKRLFAATKPAPFQQVFCRNMPPASTQFLAALGEPAQCSLLLSQMASSN